MEDEAQHAGLAEVERIRQYFPETWLWEEVITDENGEGTLMVEVPDSITTWMLRAIAVSKDNGIGIDEEELIAFQPFFMKIDLPYSAIRGEEFPLQVAVYNYLDEAQSVLVEIEEDDWFELLDEKTRMVNIDANEIGSVEFMIRPNLLGTKEIEVSARSSEVADAMITSIIIEPEGISREFVENLTLEDGSHATLDTSIPIFAVDDSGRVYLALTSSYLTQTLEGLEELIQMPLGCGEQNMMLLAPDVYITKYLNESGQLKPEIMAKAEKLMITGYQRELTYRRSDGSFSAFGESDEVGSLWLTAFVLKCFSQATELMYIDTDVLEEAIDWITSHQNNDGSFDSIGFVHHQEMLGGVTGKTALTAFTAIALLEAGEEDSAGKAVGYLENELEKIEDPYTMAIVSYALELANSDKSADAYDILMDLAEEDEDGLHWNGGQGLLPEPLIEINESTGIEATAYATLALVKHGDAFNASRAAKWLTSRRNAYGGYGSTQDTVMALQALTEYATDTRADVNLDVTVSGKGFEKIININKENYDVLQVIELPINEEVEINVEGEGEAIAQLVTRFNLPETEGEAEDIIKVDVDYDTTEVEVNDVVTVSVELEFAPPIEMEAGMIVLDVSVPTGFSPVMETIENVLEEQEKIKRYEIAGRKIIFYIENMMPGDKLSFNFDVIAMYPVKAKGVSSEAYSYYKPELKGETLSEDITIN
jgi:CD109 antigen